MGWLFGGCLVGLLIVVGGVPVPAPPPEPDAVATPVSSTAPSPETIGQPSVIAAPESLVDDTSNAFGFARLNDPDDITVEGSVSGYPAWSTSKVLVVAAFLDTVLDGDPANASDEQLDSIRLALGQSEAEAAARLFDAIPDDAAEAMTRILRDIGDTSTDVPEVDVSVMEWTVGEQVRFMAALAAGEVVSEASSALILESMQPIAEQRWGLGTISAGPFKGGWLGADTVTRQMGLVEGYAVAIITDGVGPVELQSDGDLAHVEQMNHLAELLQQRLAEESATELPAPSALVD